MILHPFNTPSVRFPIDQTFIRTSLRLSEVVAECKSEDVHLLSPDIRPYVRSISHNAKDPRPPTFIPGGRPNDVVKVPTRKIFLDGYNSIILHATKDPDWIIHTIQFNPGNTIYGHNGHTLVEDEFLKALTVLGQIVKLVLANPDEWRRVIPGVVENSPSYWHSLEIPYHVLDDTGLILRAFKNVKHERINLEPLYQYGGQSIAFKHSTKDLLIRIYRKDIEMAKAHGGCKISDTPSVLRLEAQLKDAELRNYLRSGTTKVIDGTSRLVAFKPDDLRLAHLAVMTPFKGSYHQMPALDDKSDNNERIGRFMGWISSQSDLSLEEQFYYYGQRFLAGNTIHSIRNARSNLLGAARKELALMSPVKLEELFSDAAWNSQPVVRMPKLEAITKARHEHIETDPLVIAAYGSLKSQHAGQHKEPWT